MPLHLLKLCVGVATIADLETRVAERLATRVGAGESPVMIVTTRMVPKRSAEILAGGSLYWVVKGQIAARQRVLDICPFVDAAGTGRCRLDLDPPLVPVLPRVCRAFQGWRYLDDPPPDVAEIAGASEMPEALRRSLRELCLI